MRRLAIPIVLSAIAALAAAACAGETEVVEKIVEVPVVEEKIVEVEVEKVVEVETEKVVEVEVERIVEIEVEKEKILVATPTPDVGTTGPQFGGDLRIVSQGSISTLDPVFSLFYVVNAVASQIYEGLYGWDGNLEAQPRLAESFTTNADGTEYTFTLRSGIEFHDGSSFTSEDAIASINRWRDAGTPAAGIVRRFTDDDALQAVDDTTFTWTFDEPLGAVIFILGIPHGLMPMIPSEMAGTPFTEPTPQNIGTGAYRFVEWLQGDKVVLERHDEFEPRSESSTPGAYAGENIAYLDSLTFLEIPDEETKIAGLETGEWDVVDGAGLDFYARVSDNADLTVPLYKPGHRTNLLIPANAPFDETNARLAFQTGIDVANVMASLGPSELWTLCPAIFFCGTRWETDAGADEFYNLNDKAAARTMLADSGYDGETLVLLNPTDYSTITPTGFVVKSEMEALGFNVEMPGLDWATVVTRFGNPESFAVATSWDVHWNSTSPLEHEAIGSNFPVFPPPVPRLHELRKQFAQAITEPDKLRLVDELQVEFYRNVPALYLGVFYSIYPATSALKNFEVKAFPYYANSWLER